MTFIAVSFFLTSCCLAAILGWNSGKARYWKNMFKHLERRVVFYRDTLESLHKRGMIRKEQKRGSDGRWVK